MAIQGGKRATAGPLSAAPLFTVVTSVANGAATIGRTIESVLAQSYRDFEYLVIDANSSDGTREILERYGDRIDYWQSEPDAGIYDAWNKALRLARGSWIAFLGADDQYHPDALLKYSRLLALHGNAPLHYMSSRVEYFLNGRPLQTIGDAWQWPDFAHYMTVAHVGSFHHRALFEEYGEFDPNYRICGDYELLLRPRGKLRAAFLAEPTASAAYGGVSNFKAVAALREAREAKRTSGGRAAWRCELEFLWACAKAQVRAVVRRSADAKSA